MPITSTKERLVTIFGLVVTADNVLLKHEARQRAEIAALRKEARMDFARRGIIPDPGSGRPWRSMSKSNFADHSGRFRAGQIDFLSGSAAEEVKWLCYLLIHSLDFCFLTCIFTSPTSDASLTLVV